MESTLDFLNLNLTPGAVTDLIFLTYHRYNHQ